MKLKGKRCVVTGSTKGIGLAIAECLIGEGANVVISSRHGQDVKQTVDRLKRLGGVCVTGKKCDVRESEEVRQLIGYCVSYFGGIDILVNNAGIGVFKTVEELSIQEWRDTLSTNLDGVFFGCHFAIAKMRESGGGCIVNIGSLAGKNAFPRGAAYNASKFGLTGFSEALMQEVRHDGIRVAYVMPGSVNTSFSNRSLQGTDSWKLTPLDVAEAVMDVVKHHPRSLTSRVEIRPSEPPKK